MSTRSLNEPASHGSERTPPRGSRARNTRKSTEDDAHPTRASSSRKRRTSRRATRGQCTTSSTTADGPAPVASEGVEPAAARPLPPFRIPVSLSDAPLLTPAQQAELLERMLNGCAATAACRQMELTISALNRTLAEDAAFADRVRQARDALRDIVLAALFRQAVKGSVTAQKLYLQQSPDRSQDQSPDASNAEEGLSPHELAEAYRAAGRDLPPELEALVGGPAGAVES